MAKVEEVGVRGMENTELFQECVNSGPPRAWNWATVNCQRQTETDRDRQTDRYRQRQTETDRNRQRQTERQRDRETSRHIQKQQPPRNSLQ